MRKLILMALTWVLVIQMSCRQKDEFPMRGTLVVIQTDGDSTILAADSRETPADAQSGSVTDTTVKVFNIGHTFFTTAGFMSFNGYSVKSIIRSSYNAELSLSENKFQIGNNIKDVMQKWFDLMNADAKKRMDKIDIKAIKVSTFAFCYVNNQPLLCPIVVRAVKRDGNYYASLDSLYDLSGYRIIFDGEHSEINKLVNTDFKLSNRRLDDIIHLIRLQAAHDNYVDSVINYCVVKPDGFKYGKSIPK